MYERDLGGQLLRRSSSGSGLVADCALGAVGWRCSVAAAALSSGGAEVLLGACRASDHCCWRSSERRCSSASPVLLRLGLLPPAAAGRACCCATLCAPVVARLFARPVLSAVVGGLLLGFACAERCVPAAARARPLRPLLFWAFAVSRAVPFAALLLRGLLRSCCPRALTRAAAVSCCFAAAAFLCLRAAVVHWFACRCFPFLPLLLLRFLLGLFVHLLRCAGIGAPGGAGQCTRRRRSERQAVDD